MISALWLMLAFTLTTRSQYVNITMSQFNILNQVYFNFTALLSDPNIFFFGYFSGPASSTTLCDGKTGMPPTAPPIVIFNMCLVDARRWG
jgi:hypothetical protein